MDSTKKVQDAIEVGRNADSAEVTLFVDDYGFVTAEETINALPMKIELCFELRFLVSVRVEYNHEAFTFRNGSPANIEDILVGGGNIKAITAMTKTLVEMAYAEIIGDLLEWR